MVNPNYSGSFSGFKVEVMQGNSVVISEKATFVGSLSIQPGTLQVSYSANNSFKLSPHTVSLFYINLINPVDSNG